MDLHADALVPVRSPGVSGDLRRWPVTPLPGLDRAAHLWVWLPPGYNDDDTRHPVVYLHDGDNLFLREASFAGEVWHVDRAMSALAAEGTTAIVVGVPCHPTRRGEEYTPLPHPELGGGRAEDYLRFLLDELKPAVDATLRTLPDREHTVVAGSSLGAVVSAHLWRRRPETVGGVGLFSPAFWWPGEQSLVDLEEALEGGLTGRVHLDVGGREDPADPEREQRYVADAERLLASLRRARVPVRYVFDAVAHHHETAWAGRVREALAWLLRGYAAPAPPHVDLAPAPPSG